MEQHIKFVNSAHTRFFQVLRQRVDDYFVRNKISPHANAAMVFKTIFMLTLYFLPYALMVSGTATGWAFWLCWALMGFGLAGIGMSVMHDANHKAYSGNDTVNTLLGHTVNLVGGDAKNWKAQHNILHHTFTNIHTADEDIDNKLIMRFAPTGKHKGIQRFQFLYAFVLYSVMTIYWVLLKDLVQHFRYLKKGLLKEQGKDRWRVFTVLLAWKLFYVAYMLVLPILLLPVPAWQIVTGFLLLHIIAGTVLSVVFQLAHVVESTEFPMPDAEGNIETEWAIHQLRTTADFSPGNPIITFYVGGLNYQTIHHLFPRICHIHYPKLAPIVAQTAKEFGVPYTVYPSFGSAFRSHVSMLHKLGRKDYVHLIDTMG
jgi:linoleoyl-CoA desaturase